VSPELEAIVVRENQVAATSRRRPVNEGVDYVVRRHEDGTPQWWYQIYEGRPNPNGGSSSRTSLCAAEYSRSQDVIRGDGDIFSPSTRNHSNSDGPEDSLSTAANLSRDTPPNAAADGAAEIANATANT